MVIVTHYEGSFLGDLDLTFYAFHDFLIERKVGWGGIMGCCFSLCGKNILDLGGLSVFEKK